MERRSLNVVTEEARPDRRQALLTLGVGATLAACGSGTGGTTDGGSGDSSASDGSTGADTGNGGTDTGTMCTDGTMVLGTLDMFPANSWTIITTGSGGVVVGHDSMGIYAFSAVCTHEGCLVCLVGDPDRSNCPSAGYSTNGGATVCYCHGSQFDADGNVTRTPARRPLANYLVTVCNNNVSVTTSHTVPIGTRVAV